MSKHIYNINSKGNFQGYQERYIDGRLWFKCFYNNGIPIDYEEYHHYNGELWFKTFYI